MAIARGFKPKTKLEPDEKLRCAYLYLMQGLSQQDLVIVFGGVNPARIADAIKAVAQAVEWPGREGALEEEQA